MINHTLFWISQPHEIFGTTICSCPANALEYLDEMDRDVQKMREREREIDRELLELQQQEREKRGNDDVST